jgi:hypothetical protein
MGRSQIPWVKVNKYRQLRPYVPLFQNLEHRLSCLTAQITQYLCQSVTTPVPAVENLGFQ